MCSSPRALPPVIEVPSSRRVVHVCFPCTHFTYWLLRYCLPGSRVWCSSPGAPPPVTEIPSSRRRVVCAGPGAPPPVMEIPSSRRRSGFAFRARVSHTGYGGTAFQAAVCGACIRGLHPGYGGAVFQMGCHLHTRAFSDRVAMTGAHALEIGL